MIFSDKKALEGQKSETRGQKSEDRCHFIKKEEGSFNILPSILPTLRHFSVNLTYSPSFK